MAILETDKGRVAMIMGCPMGEADFSSADFEASHPITGQRVLFGIDPEEAVELTVVNEYDKQVTHIFQPGTQPYLIKKIIQDNAVTTKVNYFI